MKKDISNDKDVIIGQLLPNKNPLPKTISIPEV